MLPHSALCFSVLKYGPQLGMSEQSRIFQFSAYTFDVGIGDMVPSLLHGATLCVPSEHERTNDLNGAIERSRSNCLVITPSVAALLERERCSSVQTLVLIGEVPTAESYELWHGRVRLFNAWGPAECAVLSTVHEIKSQNDLPTLIGGPMNCRIWLVHPSDPSRLVPSGCIGEILVEGLNVAYGYLGDEKECTDRYVSLVCTVRELCSTHNFGEVFGIPIGQRVFFFQLTADHIAAGILFKRVSRRSWASNLNLFSTSTRYLCTYRDGWTTYSHDGK